MMQCRRVVGLAAVWTMVGATVAAGLPGPVAQMQDRAVRDPRVRTFVQPVRVVWHSGGAVENAGALLQKRSGQITLDASNPCVLDSRKGAAAILLDFGVELTGGVQRPEQQGTTSRSQARVVRRTGQ